MKIANSVEELVIEAEIGTHINGQRKNTATVSSLMKFVSQNMYVRKKKMEMARQLEVVGFSMVNENL